MRRLCAVLLLLCLVSSAAFAEQARSLANFMEDHYGVTILIGDECETILTSGYELGDNPAGRTLLQSMLANPNYADEIKLIDDCLSAYPVGFFEKFVCGEAPKGLRILLPNQIVAGGTTMAGVTTVQDGYYNIFLGVGAFNGLNIHHEIWHAMEYRIISEYPDAFDDWYTLNPEDFLYDTSFFDQDIWEQDAEGGAWFVRGYSVINEIEDRATVIEAIFLHDSDWWMDHPLIQKKLDVLLATAEPIFGNVYFPE